ncbi:MAG: NUDIX hydrolase [Acidocella sp.]|nr:NUDIX hydrolase [Acidocella sp.]
MRQYPNAPQLGIGVVLLRGDEVLLVKRARPPAAGAWSLPGGKQELGERAEDTARRELFEETGLTAGPMILAGYVDSLHHDSSGRLEYHYTILDFCARYTGGVARAGDDVADVAWVAAADFDAYNLWPAARGIIARAFSLLPP